MPSITDHSRFYLPMDFALNFTWKKTNYIGEEVGEIRVDPLTRMIQIRGIKFPVDCIQAAMLETGGILVSDEHIIAELDATMEGHRLSGKGEPEMLFIEAIPAMVFVPKKIQLHKSTLDVIGRPTHRYLYFAVNRHFHV